MYVNFVNHMSQYYNSTGFFWHNFYWIQIKETCNFTSSSIEKFDEKSINWNKIHAVTKQYKIKKKLN